MISCKFGHSNYTQYYQVCVKNHVQQGSKFWIQWDLNSELVRYSNG